MNREFYLWLCYVKLLVYDPDKNSCRWDLVYRSLPAKYYNHLSGFPNEKLTIIAILKFHPMNRCAIAEIDEPEQIKASINVLMIENNLYNIRLWTTVFMKTSNLVAYYGFDVETVMQLPANKQVDIIIVNTIYVVYGDKYREVDWIETEIIQMLKSNPETAQIPVIVKLSGQVMSPKLQQLYPT